MRCQFAICGSLAVGLLTGHLEIRAGDDKVHVVGKGGLTIEGKVTENDPKFKVTPVPVEKESMLPGKMFQVKLIGGKR